MLQKSYHILKKHLHDLCGVDLGDDRHLLMETRLTPLLAQYELQSIDELIAALNGSRKESLNNLLIEALTTNESQFFRDGSPFDALREYIIPSLIDKLGKNSLRIWSAACSSGQEPYSIAMLIIDSFPDLYKRCEIVATDVSPQILEKARRGWYTDFETQRGLEARMKERFFHAKDRGWQIDKQVKELVNFELLNLIKPPYHKDAFDIVFCRNVLIYFNSETKKNVLRAIADVTKNNGFLFLGGSETAIGISSAYKKWNEVERGQVFIKVPR